MINVSIEGARQVISFADGAISNELLIRLPNGQQVSVAVDEAGMRAVTLAFAEQGGPAVERAAAAAASAKPQQWVAPAPKEELPNMGGLELEHSESHDFVFGGYEGPPDTANDAEWVAKAPVAPQVREAPLRVSADAQGNPVIQGGNSKDRSELVGGRGAELEEDGVGSV